jgi:hypothetical protein
LNTAIGDARWGDAGVGSLAANLAARQRRRMFERFLQSFSPSETSTVLDVGVTSDETHDHSNYFEHWYPYKSRVTAIGLEDASFLETRYPGMRFVAGSALKLPFETGEFDFVHSSAVIEHVGSFANQAHMLREAWRVARSGVFITTPNRWFPVEMHTVLPLVHFLPANVFRWCLRRLGRPFFADENNLNLLSKRTIAGAAASAGIEDCVIKPMRLCAFTSNLLLIAKKRT